MVNIKVENLSKKYIISHEGVQKYKTFRDTVTNGFKKLSSRITGRFFGSGASDNSTVEEFWALKDVSFEIKEGDRVGIIGRNGAGKSTLLKILSRITEPTSGMFKLKGRVASLLEVGTGFHGELTGRENIFLNGAILGMSRSEIKSKFDEIVDFSEIEKFLDTPVKRYSSGMYVRLAFAVAAHLEPEILIIDEVLAVGDIQFQKKCLGKMKEVGSQGRTVIFVSHNMNAIEQFCTSCILLERGALKLNANKVSEAVKCYLFSADDSHETCEWKNSGKEFDNIWFKPLSISCHDAAGKPIGKFIGNNNDIYVQIEGLVSELDPAFTIGYSITNEEGVILYWTCPTDVEEKDWPVIEKGILKFKTKIPKHFLNEGTYKLELFSYLFFRQAIIEPGKAPFINFTIQGNLSDSPYWTGKRQGVVAPHLEWSVIS